MNFDGIYTPVITPHREDGAIDRDGFAAMIEFLIASGVHGIINGGSTGEYYAQSMEERLEMASLAKEVIGVALCDVDDPYAMPEILDRDQAWELFGQQFIEDLEGVE